MTAAMPVPDRPLLADGGGWPSGNADSPGRTSLAQRGYVHGRFGGVPVLVGPELAAQIKAIRQKQP